MCEQTESNYLDGDVVWVKLGSCWWPGEVVGADKLPPDVLPSFRKPPIAVVKFFQESTYEYVKNTNLIYKYNCSRKNEFINKGLYLYRTLHGHMEKFPEDVIRAETAVGGDKEILTRDEFQEVKKTPKKSVYAGLFGESAKKTPASIKKGRGRGRPPASSSSESTPKRSKFYKEKSDYKVHILVQPPKEPSSQPEEKSPTPSTSRAGSEPSEDKPKQDTPRPTFTTPTASTTGTYVCPTCHFSTTRLNVLVLHNKTHSVNYTPYTPSPIRKKPAAKSPTKSATKVSKISKTPRPRKEKTEKTPKKAQGKKRTAEEKAGSEVKKAKTDQEIKSSLLADWDDDADEESNDESTGILASASPEVPAGSESPAVPTPAELPSDTSREPSSPEKKSDDTVSEKPECSSSDSKYEFCEDEDWPVEADAGRKIPRVKNPSKRKEETKSLSLEDDDVAKEVAELLNKTAVPELPSVPEPLKVEENFPEPSIVKSPDKKADNSSGPGKSSEDATLEPKPTKAIFKTKTFFRSRHSRSQDAIGKYVAEQLNAERIDTLECDINGSEVVSSPEARESPPIDHVKVARLAPKIQLKKMKDKFMNRMETPENTTMDITELEIDNIDIPLPPKSLHDVIYPTQEIKPINESEKILHKDLDCTESSNNDIDKKLGEKLKAREIADTITDEIETKLQKPTHSSPQKVTNFSIESPLKEDNVTTRTVSQSPEYKIKKYSKHQIISPEPEPKALVPVESSPLNIQNFSSKETSYSSPKREPVEPKAKTPTSTISVATPQKSFDNITASPRKTPTSTLQKSYEQMMEPFLTETTVSAVDALLSVSREADRVPRIVGSGPPEDLFEDDNKDGSYVEEEITENKDNGVFEPPDQEKLEEPIQELNGIISDKPVVEPPLVEPDVVEQPIVQSPILESAIHEPPIVEPSVIEQSETEKSNAMDIEILIPEKSDVVPEEEMETSIENVPSESDLQIAETLLNLPSTALQNKTNEQADNVPMCVDEQHFDEVVTESIVENDMNTYEVPETIESVDVASDVPVDNDNDLAVRYETEQEKSENLNAAQSLVQMSESMDHTMNVVENNVVKSKDISNITLKKNQNNGIDAVSPSEQTKDLNSKEIKIDPMNGKSSLPDTTTSKLLKILEEPPAPKPPLIKTTTIKSTTPTKKVIVTGKEKILNFDVANSSMKSKPQIPKQKIIIRRTGTGKISSGGFLNNLSDVVASPDKIILSRTNIAAQDGTSVQTFTIQASPDISTAPDAKQIIIQPKLRKVPKPATSKLQKIKPQNSLVQWNETKTSTDVPVTEEQMFDINSMPVVLSDDILTPENIEKMPFVMSDGNLITNAPSNAPKVVKSTKAIIENEKVISPAPSKPEVKKIIMSTTSDANKVTTPNILSKSAKLRAAKPMLVIDKATGKQKIIMTKTEPAVKEIKPATTLLQPVTQSAPKTEKFIIVPTGASPRGARQKIVIDPQTGKAHMLVAKGQDTQMNAPDNKPVSAKLIPPSSDASSPGNTVMIITNAQGAQSRIVLTPEHEKILFPNKQQPNVSQLKTITHRITTSNAGAVQKTIVTPASPMKGPTKILPKQKNAIITSKGQLIVGGRVATPTQNIAPMPEIRPTIKQELRTVPKRIVASEPKKLVQAIQKNTSEPLIFLQQKSGAVMQLTAAQFEHLQRTGQIIQKSAPAPENKIVVQKSITIPTPKEPPVPTIQKQQRVRKAATASPTPAKKVKQQLILAAAPAPSLAPVPPLTSLSNTVPALTPTISTLMVPPVSENISISTTGSGYPDLDNFEELLPSTAISRQVAEAPAPSPVPAPQPEASAPQPEPEPAPDQPPAQLADGQLLAVPGENFGGPVGSFYLCVEDNGTLTPIDNRPLVLENNQLVPMVAEPAPVYAPQPERRDILEAALANSDVFHAEPARDDAPDFRDLNANVSVHCRVSETSTTLHQPIMTPVEVPSKGSEPAVPSTLEDGLAVIGVTPHAVPTSLELPITVTDPRIAPRTTDPLSGSAYGAPPLPSPSAEPPFASAAAAAAGAVISMPLLTDEEAVGKSMPILTDEVAVSSVESAGSPASLDVREDDEAAWGRRLLTPATDVSDASEASAEIPLQPAIQLSVNELSRHS